MSRTRFMGTGGRSSLFLKKIKSLDFQDGMGIHENPPIGPTFSGSSSSKLLIRRERTKSNSIKKRSLIKLHQERIQVKSERIRKLRKSKLERYKIDFIPLCSDEDWEEIAKFYSNKQG